MDTWKNEDVQNQSNHGNEVEQKLNKSGIFKAGYSNRVTANNDLKC
jgi:hypothetical protein